jgi:hypothetical protein
MKCTAALGVAILLAALPVAGQEMKPVPKNSVRVLIPGCTKGYVLTAGPRSEAQPGTSEIVEGTHLRMNGPKKLIEEIRAREGSFLLITGLMKTGQEKPAGVAVGGGVRVGPGGTNGSPSASVGSSGLPYIDVEGWRPGVGECPGR